MRVSLYKRCANCGHSEEMHMDHPIDGDPSPCFKRIYDRTGCKWNFCECGDFQIEKEPDAERRAD